MNLYVVRNRDGQFFRAKGFGGSGDSWVDDLGKARFYAKIAPAKSQVTFFAKHHPKYGTPAILEFTLDVAAAKVIDMEATTQKAIKSIQQRQLEKERAANNRQLKGLLEEQKQIQSRIKSLS